MVTINGDTKDYGLNKIDVQQQGSSAYNSYGKIGKALTFSTSQWLQAPNGNSELASFDNYSITCWFYLTAKSSDHSAAFMSTGNWNSAANERTFGLYNWNTDHYSRVLIPNNIGWSNGIDLPTTDYIYLNKWYHIAISFSGTKTKLYINGKYIGEINGNKWTNTSEVNYYGIGRATYYGGFNVAGYMNDVRIYDNALSQKQISEIAKGLVLHYDLEDPYVEPTLNLITSQVPADYNSTHILTSELFRGQSVYTITGTSASNSGWRFVGEILLSPDSYTTYSIWVRRNGGDAFPYGYIAGYVWVDGVKTYKDPIIGISKTNKTASNTYADLRLDIYDENNNLITYNDTLMIHGIDIA